MGNETNTTIYKIIREVVHITLCVASVIIYGVFGVILGSLLVSMLLVIYVSNEYMRLKGLQTPLTKIYKHLLLGRETTYFAKSPLFLGLSVSILMIFLPFREASMIALIIGLGDGLTGLMRILQREYSENLKRIKSSLAGFTITALIVSVFYESYTVFILCSASSIVEALILKIDDNISIPLTATTLLCLIKSTGLNMILKNLIENIDSSVYLTVRELWLNSPLTAITPLLIILDTVLPIIYFLPALLILIKHKKLKDITILIAFILITFTFVDILKNVFRKCRPPTSIKRDYSFPSNHAAWAGTAIGFFYNSSKWLSSYAYILSILTVLEALILGNHWFSDLTAGLLIGLFIALPFNSFLIV